MSIPTPAPNPLATNDTRRKLYYVNLRKWALEQIAMNTANQDFPPSPEAMIDAAEKLIAYAHDGTLPETKQPHFFVLDGESNVYCIPEKLHALWNDFIPTAEFEREFSRFRVYGDISDIIVFLNK